MLLEVGDFATNAHCAEGSFSADVRVGGGNDRFDFGKEVSRHLDAGNVAECAKGKANNILIVVIKVAVNKLASILI